MDVGDAAVGGPGLLAVDNPLVGRLVVLGGGADRRDVGAGVRLGGAEGGDLGVLGAAEALRDPLADLLAGPLTEDRGDGQRGAHDRHADAGVAPEELLVGDRQGQTGRIGEELPERFEAVEADLGRLLDHRPGSLLALVPFRRGGTDYALGEAVHPLADVLLVLVQLEGEDRTLGGPVTARKPRPRCSPWLPLQLPLYRSLTLHRFTARDRTGIGGDLAGAQTSRRSKALMPSGPASEQSKKRRLTQS